MKVIIIGCIFKCLLALALGATVPREIQRKGEISPVIHGGHEAEKGEFPHQIQLMNGSMHYCGASIIAEQWILTAAHCFRTASPDNFVVIAGQLKQDTDDGTEQIRKIEELIIHPLFNPNEHPLDYDVAVVKVDKKFEFNEYVKPIALLPEGTDVPLGKGVVSGWGASDDEVSPNHLQKLDVTIHNGQVCKDAYDYLFTDNMLCATGNLDEGGQCIGTGDAGSPLLSLETDQLYQVGVVSWGTACDRPNRPDAYTNVAKVIDFIREHVPE